MFGACCLPEAGLESLLVAEECFAPRYVSSLSPELLEKDEV